MKFILNTLHSLIYVYAMSWNDGLSFIAKHIRMMILLIVESYKLVRTCQNEGRISERLMAKSKIACYLNK